MWVVAVNIELRALLCLMLSRIWISGGDGLCACLCVFCPFVMGGGGVGLAVHLVFSFTSVFVSMYFCNFLSSDNYELNGVIFVALFIPHHISLSCLSCFVQNAFPKSWRRKDKDGEHGDLPIECAYEIS